MAVYCKGSQPSKQGNTAELDVVNIDNTAPVKKILQSLQQKSTIIKASNPYKFYCQTIRQRRTCVKLPRNLHCAVPGHTLYAFDDEWDGQMNRDYFEVFSYKSKMPLYITPMRNIDKFDPVTEYIKQKCEWQQTCFNIKTACGKDEVRYYDDLVLLWNIPAIRLTAWQNTQQRNEGCKKVIGVAVTEEQLVEAVISVEIDIIENYEPLNEKVIYCPQAVVELAAALDSDPDPYYTEVNYNWYYAGNGNMQLVCIRGLDYLLHSQFNCLYLSRFHKQDTSMENEYEAIFDCGTDNNILETVCSSENDLVALRTKFKVFILKINTSDEKIVFEKLKAPESEVPFVSVSFDNYHKNILYITTLDNKLTLVNVDRLKGRSVKLDKKSDTFVDNWHTVIGVQRSYYTHVGKKSIEIYEKSTNNVVNTWSGLRDVTDEMLCNDITAAKQIPGSSYLYFCSDHHLFLMDLRNTSTNKPKVVQRWTHGMQCVPTYMSLCHFEFNKELICLSSQWCEDMCVVPNYEDKSRSVPGAGVPLRPPGVLDALRRARERRLCHDVYNPIEPRLTTSITGTLIFERGENYVILMHNALGDVTAHTLYPEHMEMFVDDDGVERLDRWSKNYFKENKHIEISSIVNIGSVWRELKRVPDTYTVGEGEYKFPRESEFSEREIHDATDDEKIDGGLMDIWFKNPNETYLDESSIALEKSTDKSVTLNLHYSDSE